MKTSIPSNAVAVHRCILLLTLVATALVLPPHQCDAQPIIQWQAVYGGTGYDRFSSIVATTDNGALLGGYSDSGSSGNKTTGNVGEADYWIVKIDANGGKQWERSFGGSENDFLHGVQPMTDGGYLLAGSSYSSLSGDKTVGNFGRSDYWLVKVDAEGEKVWEQVYGGESRDFVETMTVAGDGNFLIAGESESDASGNKTEQNRGGFDFWAVKVDHDGGDKIWERSFGGEGGDFCYAVLPTDDGGCLLGGESNSPVGVEKSAPNIGRYDFWLVKLDADGNKQWDKTYGGGADDWLTSIAPAPDGGWLLGGQSRSGITGNKTSETFGFVDYWLVRVDAQGGKLWEKSFGGGNNDFLETVVPTPDGNFLVGGFSYSPASGNKTSPRRGEENEDFWVIKIDQSGNKIWEETFGGEDYDDLYAAGLMADGGFLLGGVSRSGVSGNKTVANFGDGDGWFVKLVPEPLPLPSLSIVVAGNDVIVSWPSPSTGFVLEQSTAPASDDWSVGGQTPVNEGASKSVNFTPTEPQTYFRLKKSN